MCDCCLVDPAIGLVAIGQRCQDLGDPQPRVAAATLMRRVVLCLALAFCARRVSAQPKQDADHVAVLEIGGAADWGLTGGPVGLGGTLAVEVTPIEQWLEIEAGVTALGANGRKEFATDLLLKKPFQLSPGVELMAGAGPELSWNLAGAHQTQALTTEFALDLMIWPTKNVGWYVEPSYDISGFGATSTRSLGVDAGLIIGVP